MNVSYDRDGSGYASADEAAAGYAEGGTLQAVAESDGHVQFESLDGDGSPIAVIDVARLPGSGEWVATGVQTCFK